MTGSLAATQWRLSDVAEAEATRTAADATGDVAGAIEAHYPRILRAALLMTGSRSDAEDLAQETFLQALKSRRAFEGRSRIDTWLYAILLNLHRRRLRSRQRVWRRVCEWFARRSSAAEVAQPQQAAELAEWRESVWSAVAELPLAQAHAVTLRYAEGLSYQEIAAVLDCPVGTVKSRLHHALESLRAALQGFDP
jgi:RNA polymerase sigma-70 factor, ECF subfamily